MQLSRDTKRFFLLLATFTVALVLCVNHFAVIGTWLTGALASFSPFIVGGCLAFIISVPMRLFDRILSKKTKSGKPLVSDKKRKAVSLILAILLIFLLVSLFGVIVMPQLVDTVTRRIDYALCTDCAALDHRDHDMAGKLS